ncbi:3-isopropylmalate dehydratase large subunit [Novosphingobium sp.]|uniref:3-isopropylmalate dehydratase large subunit n=1 Tax=Novosphingobium sp. TaxID=1874826 RepID=UPI0027328257|nr:3-isopropylmalate dehydratase large subunit [Novosphingobium sp.]MDP3908576.1 3-isopropylmalate dehydratase large subunit [Novosphingobium sp.]
MTLPQTGLQAAALTLHDKLWNAHLVAMDGDEAILYVDLHLLHEATTPQAFEGLRLAGRTVRQPSRVLALADHSVPTHGQSNGVGAVRDAAARLQLQTLAANVAEFGIESFALGDARNGIVHVVAPEQGRTQPGMTIACGDSHTSTHGAFGALAFGIGTSDVEHVLATQTLRRKRPRSLRVTLDGALRPGITAKDIALHVVRELGQAGATGFGIEFAGPAVRALSMEARMTLCNMSIEAGAPCSLIAPDAVTLAYLEGRPAAPRGAAWQAATARWLALTSDPGAVFDREVVIDVGQIEPLVSWGTSPAQTLGIGGVVPDPAASTDPREQAQIARALEYMGLTPGQPLLGLGIDRVFIGSCTNARIDDLRAAAAVVRGRRVAATVRAQVVPGSGLVKAQAEAEGLDQDFLAAGFEWREPGCSLCAAMNDDRLEPGERCASTSNRNFENRQGTGGRTHLMSPAMAAAAAIAGRIVDVRALWPGVD